MSSDKHHTLTYRPEIDGLRALAILLVVGFHALPEWVKSGFIGVDIFFVISGYLITGIILKEIGDKKFSLVTFYVRRCRRIFPALAVVLLTVWALGWVWMLPSEFGDLGKAIYSGAGFAENILLMGQAGYFDAASVHKPLLHLWSLGVEEQYYFFWPLILMLLAALKLRMRYVLPVFFFASFVFGIWYAKVNPVAAFYLLPTRFWELLSGACLVYFEMRASGRSLALREDKIIALPLFDNPKTNNALAFIALAGALVFGVFFNQGELFSGWWAILPCFAAVVLIGIGKKSAWAQAMLANKPAVFIGKISYPLYLWHWPLLSFAYLATNDKPSLALRLGVVALSFLLAWLTYVFIEKPIQRSRLSEKRFTFLASALAVIALIGGLGYITSAEKGFLNEKMLEAVAGKSDLVDVQGALRTLNPAWWNENGLRIDDTCIHSKWVEGVVVDYCRQTSPRPTLAIIGDSHANHLVPGLEALKNPRLSNLIQVSFGGCVSFDGARLHNRQQPKSLVDDCTRGNDALREKIIRDPAIKTVIFSMLDYSSRDLDDARNDSLKIEALPPLKDQDDKVGLYRASLSRTISAFEKAGKQVIYVSDVPRLGFDPVDCLDARPFSLARRSHDMICAVSKARIFEDQKLQPIKMIAALAKEHPRMKVFDPMSVLCDETWCYAAQNKKMLYRDSNHLSLDGSVFVAKALQSALYPQRRAH